MPITKLKPELYSDAQRVASFFAHAGNYLLCGRAAVAFKFSIWSWRALFIDRSLTPQSTGPTAFFVRVYASSTRLRTTSLLSSSWSHLSTTFRCCCEVHSLFVRFLSDLASLVRAFCSITAMDDSLIAGRRRKLTVGYVCTYRGEAMF